MVLKADDTLLGGKYRIRKVLGKGGFGFVYLAQETTLDEERAIKELIPALVHDEVVLKRFLTEAEATMRLTHEGIVRTYDLFREGENYYIAMEYLPGGSLEDRLQAQGVLPIDEATRIVAEVCEALGYAHRRGAVHCDLKPANILFAAKGSAKVADFGIAHFSQDMLTHSWRTPAAFVAGTLPYMSPEQTEGVRDDARIDVYALVTTIYEDSFDRAMAEIPEARDMVGDTLYELWCARHTEEDLAAITAAVEELDGFEELAARLERDPVLALAWQRQEAYLIEQLQMHMAQRGMNVEPGFFTPEEAALPLIMMERRYWNRPWSPSRYSIGLAMMNFARCIRETLDEIVLPDRMAQMSQGLQSVGQACLEADDEHLRSLVPHVQAAIHHLQSETQPSQNQVVTAPYVGSWPRSTATANPPGLR
jgi:serine/threonine protein kinase